MKNEKTSNTGSHKWFRRVILLTVVLLAGTICAWLTAVKTDKRMREELLYHADMLAQTINTDLVRSLSGTNTDIHLPHYQRLKEQLISIRSFFTQYKFFYLMGRRENTVFFQVDSEPEGSADSSPPGQIYEEVTKEDLQAFNEKMAIISGPMTDRWGTWVSALIPITDPKSGKLITVLGIDAEAKDWEWQVIEKGVLPIALTVSAMIMLLLAGWYLLDRRNRLKDTPPKWMGHIELIMLIASGFLVTFYTSWLAHDISDRNQVAMFRRLADSQTKAFAEIFRDLKDYEIESLAMFYKSSERVTAREYTGYVNYLTKNPIVQTWEWVPAVPASEKDIFEQQARAEGMEDFEIWQMNVNGKRMPASGRDVYYPVFRVVPEEENRSIIGFDVGSEPVRAAGIEKALHTGLITATDPVTLVHDSSRKKGIVICQPVFSDEKSRQLIGLARAVMQLDDMMKKTIPDNSITLKLLLISTGKSPEILVSSTPDIIAPEKRLTMDRPVLAFGKTYIITAYVGPKYLFLYHGRSYLIVLFTGLLLTIALAIIFSMIIRRREALEGLVEERTIALKASEQHLSATLRSIGDGVIVCDCNGLITGINNAAETLTGWKRDEAKGEPVEKIFHIIDARTREKAVNPFMRTVEEGINIEIDNHTVLISRSGREYQISDSCAPIRDTKGAVTGAVLVFRDVTEQNLKREELRKSELKYRMLFENMNAAFALHEMIYDKEGKPVDCRFLEVNPMFEKLTNSRAEQLLGRTVREVLPEIETYWIEILGKVAQTGEPVYFQNYWQQLGKHFDTFAFSPQKDRVALFFVDITERVQAEDELKKFFTVNLDLLCIADIDGHFIKTNEAWSRILGYSTSELNGMKFMDFVHPDDTQSTLEAMNQLSKGEEVLNFINRYRCKDGSYRFIEWRSYPSGKFVYAAARDITDRKMTEEVLRENEARLRAITDSAQDAIIMVDSNDAISFWNPASEKILGYTANEVIGKNLHELVVPERFLDAHRAAFPEFIKTGKGNGIGKVLDLAARRKDGKEIPVSLSLSAVSIHDEWHAVGILRDVTDIKLADTLLKIRISLWESIRNLTTEELLQKVLDEVGALTDSPIGFYHFMEKDQKTLSLQAWSTRTVKEFCKAESKGMHYNIDQAGVWVDCVREKRPVIHNNYMSLPHRKGLPEGHTPVIREIVVPVIKGGDIVAIMGIGNKPYDYNEKDLETVKYLADVAWGIIIWKRMQDALSKSEAELKEAHNIAKMGRWDYYHTENLLTCTEYVFFIFEIDCKEIENSSELLLERVHPDDRKMVEEAYQKSLSDRMPYTIEHRLLMHDGRVKWVFLHCRTEFDNQGQPIRSTGVVQEITERRKAEEQTRFLANITENMSDAVIATDTEHRIIYINRKAEELYGYRPEELLGKHPKILDAGPYVENIQKELYKTISSGRKYSGESFNKRRDGSTFLCEYRILPLFDKEGKITSNMGIHVDITERKRAEDALRKAKEEAESANHAKSEFLANMSHEIRTPMNAVISLSRLMEDTPLDEQQRDYLGKIKGSSRMLLGIINDILDFSKIEAGKLELENKIFALKELLDQLKTLFVSMAHKKGIELVLDADADLPREVVGDSLRLGQVLANLISNAIKFTESGHVVLKISRADERFKIQGSRFKEKNNQGFCRIRFSVEDSGIGISEELLTKLFKPFSQADTSTTRRYGGTGLGLVISRRLVELMGGRLEVTSIPGKGSKFFFEIEMPVKSGSIGISDRPVMLVDNMSFLVVDDQETARLVLRHIIESWHGHVDEAASGLEAVNMVRASYEKKRPYNFILMDWKMPGELDGLSAIKRIRDMHDSGVLKGPEPPVFIISTYNRNELPDTETNFQAFLNKPVTASDLFNAITEVTGGITKVQYQHDKPVSIPSFEGYTILLVEDNDLNRLVATKFIEKTGAKVIIAKNGLEAIEIFSNKTVDLILMDLQMPEMDGFEATKRIRSMESGSMYQKNISSRPDINANRIPIIALTAAVMEHDRERAASSGVDRHLSKPLDEWELYRVMMDFLESKAIIETPVTNAPKTQEPFPVLEGFDLKQGRSASQGDPAFYRKLLRGFDKQLSVSFSNMTDNMSNLEINEIQQVAHALKGIAGTVGATVIADLASKIDKMCKTGARPSKDMALKLRQAINSARKEIGSYITTEPVKEVKMDDQDGLKALNELLVLLTNNEIAEDTLLNKAISYVGNRIDNDKAYELRVLVENFDMDHAAGLVTKIIEELKS